MMPPLHVTFWKPVLAMTALVAALSVLVTLASDVQRELRTLGTASTDSTVWSVAQLDVEFGRLRSSGLEAALDPSFDLNEVRTNFDIFYSRVDIVTDSPRYRPVPTDPVFESALDDVHAFLTQAVPIIDAPDAVLRGQLDTLNALIRTAEADVRAVAVEGQAYSVALSQVRRTNLSNTLQLLALVIGTVLLVLVAVAIILVRVLMSSQSRARVLQETSNRLRTVVATSLDAILVTDSMGRIRTANAAAVAMFGQTEPELYGKRLSDILVADTGPVRDEQAALAHLAGRGRIRLSGLTTDGARFPAEFSLQRARLENSDIYVVFVRDISIQLRAENALVSARDQAIATERAKTDFVAMMSHEIRTPLHGLLGSLALLLQTRLGTEQARYAENMETSGRLLLNHVEDVLDVARHDAGHMRRELEPVDLSALLEDAVRGQCDLAATAENQIGWRWIGPPRDHILTDPNKLRRVLSNLLGNAVKFTRGGVIELTAEEVGADAGTILRIRITDTGRGIDPDRIERIFDDFETSPRSHHGEIAGTGLGLGIARRLARVLGGEIGVDSTLGKGSTFWLDLPVLTPEVGTETGPYEPAAAKDMPMRTILLADDNEIGRSVLRDMLELDGHVVVEAGDGQQAVTLAGEHAYDLILMDVAMPVMDGCTAAQLIRKSGLSADAPILAVTAHALPEEIERFRAFGLTGVMLKPVRLDTLRETCRDPHGAGFAPLRHAVAGTDDVDEIIGADARKALVVRFRAEARDLVSQVLDDGADDATRAAAAHLLAGSAGALGFAHVAQAAIDAELAFGKPGHGPDADRAPMDAAERLAEAVAAVTEDIFEGRDAAE
ncbi:hybrid sensor histidine kinase/response regulator [Anianabacter salinae]|uniref:hybrid sensor histidine kinase/response regulator n=1 Tax=Anianabacter salinae TaxID=2851023 RepID=UPI00225E57AB|nr:ATP-binding protein [Anianabacter salinae]MBV0911135.1 response regulator [Anianabacter salinae]